MRPGPILYAAACLLALSYLTFANMRGYVPFAASVSHSIDRGATAGHFHK
jgi:hypothetical protein